MGKKERLNHLILLKICCTKSEVHFLGRVTESILGNPTPFVALLYNFEPY